MKKFFLNPSLYDFLIGPIVETILFPLAGTLIGGWLGFCWATLGFALTHLLVKLYVVVANTWRALGEQTSLYAIKKAIHKAVTGSDAVKLGVRFAASLLYVLIFALRDPLALILAGNGIVVNPYFVATVVSVFFHSMSNALVLFGGAWVREGS